MRLTADLKARLRAAIDGEAWDAPGETTERDRALVALGEVPNGTDLATAEFEDDGLTPTNPAGVVYELVTYFGFDNVAGDWHEVAR